MARSLCYLLFVSSFVFSSCQPKKIEKGPPTMESTIKALPIPLTEGSHPQWADSIVTYRPVFGKAGTPLQPPFGSANKFVPKVRLSTVLYNGKKWRTYQYDSQGRLVNRTNYYTDGEHILGRKEYYYEDDRLSKIIGYLNKEVQNLESIPKSNDLRLNGEVNFSVIKGEFAWIEIKTRIEFEIYHDRKSTTYSYLGFDPAGAMIWQETRDPQGRVSFYSLHRRNETGNIILHRYAYASHDWGFQGFTYDNKPNPYRTTGEFQPNDVFDFDASNVNNVLTQNHPPVTGSIDNWQYDYQYRPDGYPSKVIVYRDGELERTLEYLYNQ